MGVLRTCLWTRGLRTLYRAQTWLRKTRLSSRPNFFGWYDSCALTHARGPFVLTDAFLPKRFVQKLAWVLSTGFSVLAILLFYIRIFLNTWVRKAIYLIGAWDVFWTVPPTPSRMINALPLTFFGIGIRIDSNAFYFTSGLTSTVTVVTTLYLPLPIVWRLRLSALSKMGLAISFIVEASYMIPRIAF